MTTLPTRSKLYNSDTSRSEIWARFTPRHDDVFVCTPPKSGTTWMQSLCGMLIFRDAEVNPGIGTISRWLDSAFNEEAELMPALESQTHRRYIKTHTPLDGITYDPGCTYITVYRHPLDVIFSAQKHLRNMTGGIIEHLIADDMNEGAREWIEKPFSYDQNIGESLSSLINHYKSFLDWDNLPNIHFFHYEDMKRDLRGAVARLADILGTPQDEALLDAVKEAGTFSSMKSKAEKYAPSADRGIWKSNAQFFESGSSRKWDGTLSDDVLAAYDKCMGALLSPSERTWLENGSG